LLEDMRRPPSTIKYWAGKDIPGLEVLFADDRLDAKAVWKNGGDFRLLTADKVRRVEIDSEIEAFNEDLPENEEGEAENDYGEDERVSKEKAKREYENFAWNDFSAGTIGSVTTQPSAVEFIPPKDNFEVAPRDGRWKALAGGVEIRTDDKGLYKIVSGRITKIRNGSYAEPVITPNGRCVVATKYDDDEGSRLVRVNLATNKEFVVDPGELGAYRAIAYVSSIDRIIVGPEQNEYDYDEDKTSRDDEAGSYALLDAQTGVLIPARGEIRPLVQQTLRALQPAAKPFEFWAAISNENETLVGIYNARTFTIKPLLKLPKIGFNSMDMWADEVGGKIYFIYEGHLLSAPIKVGP